MEAPPSPVGRFAPSPTGSLHLGSLTTCLGSYLMARRQGGRWLVRIEDLDGPRTIPGMADEILRTLEALGFRWDGEVLFQSRRADLYREVLETLSAKGLTYPCGCSRAEIARVSTAPHGADEGPAYPGSCRDGLPPGKTPRSLRLRVSDEEISFTDALLGPVSQRLARACGDFPVQRADGGIAYHLAVVVDDALSGVTQVVRGADLAASTPRQIYLQRLLGYATPSYAHLPLVTGTGGAKLSKRDSAVSTAGGRGLGRAASTLLRAALRFLGQDTPAALEGAPATEILEWAGANFDPGRVPNISRPFGWPRGVGIGA